MSGDAHVVERVARITTEITWQLLAKGHAKSPRQAEFLADVIMSDMHPLAQCIVLKMAREAGADFDVDKLTEEAIRLGVDKYSDAPHEADEKLMLDLVLAAVEAWLRDDEQRPN